MTREDLEVFGFTARIPEACRCSRGRRDTRTLKTAESGLNRV